MDRVFYQAASAMMLQQKKLETVSNNLSNIRTAGYKPETVTTMSFDRILSARQDEDGIYYDSTPIGTIAPLGIVDDVVQYFSQGDISQTSRVFDFAISGDGYFNIVNEDGDTLYTRNGAFQLDDEGYLELAGYGRVQGQKGDILIGTADFSVDTYGTIRDAEGNEIDSFKTSWVEDITKMKHHESGLYRYMGDDEPYDFQTTIYQGALESSTVDLTTEMTRMMTIQSRFTAMATVLQTINEVNGNAATQIGNI